MLVEQPKKNSSQYRALTIQHCLDSVKNIETLHPQAVKDWLLENTDYSDLKVKELTRRIVLIRRYQNDPKNA